MSTGSGPPLLAEGFVVACVLGVPWATNAWFGMTALGDFRKVRSPPRASAIHLEADLHFTISTRAPYSRRVSITKSWP